MMAAVIGTLAGLYFLSEYKNEFLIEKTVRLYFIVSGFFVGIAGVEGSQVDVLGVIGGLTILALAYTVLIYSIRRFLFVEGDNR